MDFGYVGRLYDLEQGRLWKAWEMVIDMVMGYRRYLVAWSVLDQQCTTWRGLHSSGQAALSEMPPGDWPQHGGAWGGCPYWSLTGPT